MHTRWWFTTVLLSCLATREVSTPHTCDVLRHLPLAWSFFFGGETFLKSFLLTSTSPCGICAHGMQQCNVRVLFGFDLWDHSRSYSWGGFPVKASGSKGGSWPYKFNFISYSNIPPHHPPKKRIYQADKLFLCTALKKPVDRSGLAAALRTILMQASLFDDKFVVL